MGPLDGSSNTAAPPSLPATLGEAEKVDITKGSIIGNRTLAGSNTSMFVSVSPQPSPLGSMALQRP